MTDFIDPVLVCSAKHSKIGVTVKFNDVEYKFPREHIWHVFDVLRSHIEDYGAMDTYGREIATDDI
jgi:hypothetical protein